MEDFQEKFEMRDKTTINLEEAYLRVYIKENEDVAPETSEESDADDFANETAEDLDNMDTESSSEEVTQESKENDCPCGKNSEEDCTCDEKMGDLKKLNSDLEKLKSLLEK